MIGGLDNQHPINQTEIGTDRVGEGAQIESERENGHDKGTHGQTVRRDEQDGSRKEVDVAVGVES